MSKVILSADLRMKILIKLPRIGPLDVFLSNTMPLTALESL